MEQEVIRSMCLSTYLKDLTSKGKYASNTYYQKQEEERYFFVVNAFINYHTAVISYVLQLQTNFINTFILIKIEKGAL